MRLGPETQAALSLTIETTTSQDETMPVACARCCYLAPDLDHRARPPVCRVSTPSFHELHAKDDPSGQWHGMARGYPRHHFLKWPPF